MISTSIQGGAAGVFLAGHIKSLRPNSRVILLEATRTLLKKVKIRIPHLKNLKDELLKTKKVKISGGGRCNVTHRALPPRDLSENYPRG